MNEMTPRGRKTKVPFDAGDWVALGVNMYHRARLRIISLLSITYKEPSRASMRMHFSHFAKRSDTRSDTKKVLLFTRKRLTVTGVDPSG